MRRNELLELLSNPRELARRYGLTALIIVLAAVVAIWLIVRASGAEDRKWHRAWSPLERAAATHNEEQLRGIADKSKTKPLVRAWANIKLGELLYNRTQQSDDFQQVAAREELLNQAINYHQQALRIGQEWREVVGQATIGMALCYENLGRFNQARQQYEQIISQSEERFAGTIWLAKAQSRLDKAQNRKSLDYLADEKVVFEP